MGLKTSFNPSSSQFQLADDPHALLNMPPPPTKVAAVPAFVVMGVSFTVLEAAIVLTAGFAMLSAVLVDKKSASQALAIGLRQLKDHQQELGKRLEQAFKPFLQNLELATKQTGADIKDLLNRTLISQLPKFLQNGLMARVDKLLTLAPPNSIQAYPKRPPSSISKARDMRDVSSHSAPPKKLSFSPVANAFPSAVVPSRHPSSILPKKIEPQVLPVLKPFKKPTVQAPISARPTPTVDKPVDMAQILGPAGPIAVRLSDLKTAKLMLQASASRGASEQEVSQAHRNLQTAYGEWAREILGHPQLKTLAAGVVTAAVGGSPLKPDDDKLVKMLLRAIGNGIGCVAGASIEAWISGSIDPDKNAQRLGIALLVGAAVPSGTSLAEGMASNALANLLDEFIGQKLLGIYEKDSLAYGWAVGGGIVSEGLGRALEPVLAKGMQRWSRSVAGITPTELTDWPGSPLRMNGAADFQSESPSRIESPNGRSSGYSSLTPEQKNKQDVLWKSYESQQQQLLADGFVDSETAEKLRRIPLIGNIPGPGAIALPTSHGFFGSLQDAREAIASLIGRGNFPGELAIDIFQVNKPKSPDSFYLVSISPGGKRRIRNEVLRQRHHPVENGAVLNELNVDLLTFGHNHPGGSPLPSGLKVGERNADISLFSWDASKGNLYTKQSLVPKDFSVWCKPPGVARVIEVSIKFNENLTSEQIKYKALEIIQMHKAQNPERLEHAIRQLFVFSKQSYDLKGKPIGKEVAFDVYEAYSRALLGETDIFSKPRNYTYPAVLFALAGMAGTYVAIELKKQSAPTKPTEMPQGDPHKTKSN
jgi:hypothetical protein